MLFEYKIEGIPIPWAAPQRRGDQYFNPKHIEKEQVIWQLRSQKHHETLFCACRLNVTFYMPIPKKVSSIQRRQMLNGMIPHKKKPDRSNMLKFIEDCLQGALIIDNDSQIVAGETHKCYGNPPRTEIFIFPFLEIEAKYASRL